MKNYIDFLLNSAISSKIKYKRERERERNLLKKISLLTFNKIHHLYRKR